MKSSTKKSTALTGQDADNLLHFLLETDVEDAVALVDDEALQVLEEEVARVLQVVEQSARRRHQNVDALDQFGGLGLPVGPAHHQAVRVRMVPGAAKKIGKIKQKSHELFTGTSEVPFERDLVPEINKNKLGGALFHCPP